MFESSRPDVTNEGWNTWPTEAASHALVRQPQLRAAIQVYVENALLTTPTELAALQLASDIRDVVESAAREGDAPELRESLFTYALSRVDWIQLAHSQIAAALPESFDKAA